MTRFAAGAACVAAFTLGLVAVWGTSSCSHACTAVGCSSGVVVTLVVPFSVRASAGGRLVACRARVCGEAVLVAEEPDAMSSTQLRVEPAPGGSWRIGGFIAESTGRPNESYLRVIGELQPGREDGELFSLEVFDAAGKRLFQRTDTLTYRVSYPNGPDCEPRCEAASVRSP